MAGHDGLLSQIEQILATSPGVRLAVMPFGDPIADAIKFAIDVEEFMLQARSVAMVEQATEILHDELERASATALTRAEALTRARRRLLQLAVDGPPAPART